MDRFTPVYVPAGVGTFHMERAGAQFEQSCALLRRIDERFVLPEDMLLSPQAIRDFLAPLRPDLIVFQNLTFG